MTEEDVVNYRHWAPIIQERFLSLVEDTQKVCDHGRIMEQFQRTINKLTPDNGDYGDPNALGTRSYGYWRRLQPDNEELIAKSKKTGVTETFEVNPNQMAFLLFSSWNGSLIVLINQLEELPDGHDVYVEKMRNIHRFLHTRNVPENVVDGRTVVERHDWYTDPEIDAFKRSPLYPGDEAEPKAVYAALRKYAINRCRSISKRHGKPEGINSSTWQFYASAHCYETYQQMMALEGGHQHA